MSSPLLPLIGAFIVALVIIGLALAERRGGIPFIKEAIGLKKSVKIKEENGKFKGPVSSKLFLHHATKGQVVGNGYQETPDGGWTVYNKEGNPAFEIHAERLKPRTASFNTMIRSGSTRELHFDVIDNAYTDKLKAENESLILANRSKHEELLHHVTHTVGEHRIAEAKIQGKVNVEKYRGIRVRQPEKKSSQPVVEYVEEGDG